MVLASSIAQQTDYKDKLQPAETDRTAIQKEAAPSRSEIDALSNEPSAKANPEVQEKVKALTDEISLLKGLGYKVAVREGITIGGDKLHVSDNVDLTLLVVDKELAERYRRGGAPSDDTELLLHERFPMFGAADPWQLFAYHNGFCRDILPALSEKSGVVEVSPFCLEAKRIGAKEGVVRVYDCLSGKNEPVYERKVKLEGDGPSDEFYFVTPDDLRRLRQEIPAVLYGKRGQHQAFVDQIPASVPEEEHRFAVSFVEGKKLSVDELQAARELVANSTSGLIIEGVPKGQAEDRVFRIDNFAKSLSVTLSPQALEGQEVHPVLLRGDVSEVAFVQNFELHDVNREEKTINGRKVDKIVENSHGGLYTSYQYVDKYGNLVIENMSVWPNLGAGRRSVEIFVPTRFVPENEATGKVCPVNFDLTALGLGEVKNLVYTEPESVIGQAGKYSISTNMAPDEVATFNK